MSTRCCSSVAMVMAPCAASAPAGGWRLRLVRLARPAPTALQRLILDGERIEIPPADVERFAGEICPVLRGVATIVSSDGSFTPPEISAPSLVLRAAFSDGHRVEVDWAWAYWIGASTWRA